MYRQSCVTDVDHGAERWFAAVPNAEDGARIFVRRTLERWNLSMLAHTAKLIIAELVRRSLAQASADYPGLLSVRLARSDVLYMAVWDPYETLPATEADGDHGFKVVEGLCDRWGYQPLSGGKTRMGAAPLKGANHEQGVSISPRSEPTTAFPAAARAH